MPNDDTQNYNVENMLFGHGNHIKTFQIKVELNFVIRNKPKVFEKADGLKEESATHRHLLCRLSTLIATATLSLSHSQPQPLSATATLSYSHTQPQPLSATATLSHSHSQPQPLSASATLSHSLSQPN